MNRRIRNYYPFGGSIYKFPNVHLSFSLLFPVNKQYTVIFTSFTHGKGIYYDTYIKRKSNHSKTPQMV